MSFINVINRVNDGQPIVRDWSKHKGVTVHRVGEDHETGITLGSDAIAICDHFTGRDATYPEVKQTTGGSNPYSIIIGKLGQRWQCLPLSDVGHHARRWSYLTIGVAVIGDPRHEPLTPEQHWALVDTCVILAGMPGSSSRVIRGHDERKGASRDPRKECPGRLLDLAELRREVELLLLDDWRRRAHEAGLVL